MNVSHPRGESGEELPNVFEIGQGGALPAPTPEAPPPAPTPSAHRAAPGPAEAVSTQTILAQLRARLAVVKREIRARRKLEVEKNQLERLIRAAREEKDNVRRLRAAG